MITVTTLSEFRDAIAVLPMLEIGYTRVSTEQEHQDSSVRRQVEDFRDNNCNLVLVERETGTSSEKRPLYQELISLVKAKKVLKICVTKSSRLNRNAAENTYFERLCEVNRVPIFYLDQPELNVQSLSASLLRREEAIAAETYSKRLSVDLRKGNQRLRRNLKPMARIATFGYRFSAVRDYEINWVDNKLNNIIGIHPETDKKYATGELARFIIEQHLYLESQAQAFKQFKQLLKVLEPINQKLIDKHINLSQKWFSDWLKDPTIRGCIAYGRYKEVYVGDRLEKIVRRKAPRSEWEIHPDCHPALISSREWQQIKMINERSQNTGWNRSKSRRNPHEPQPLSKIIKCQCCKSSYNTQSTNQDGNRFRYYRCVGRREHRCDQSGIGEATLVKSLVRQIIGKAEQLTDILHAAKTKQQDPRSDRITELQEEANNLLLLHKASGRSSYLQTYQEVTTEIKAIEEAILFDVDQWSEKQEVLEALQDIDFWDSMTRVELHKYLTIIVATAWIENKQVVTVELSL